MWSQHKAMNNRTTILNELQIVAPGLVHLPFTMPFTTPEGYFENLSDNLLHIVKDEDPALPLLTGGKKMPYQVPTGYFENLAMNILEKVNEKQTVPEGYFDSLPQMLLDKVRRMEVVKELETVAPLLNTISKKPVQFMPEGYFEQLEPAFKQATIQQIPVVSIKKKTGWFKYAAAASVILFLSFGAFRYFNKPVEGGFVAVSPETVKTIDKQLAQLDDATIENYLQENESVTETNAAWYKNTQEVDIENLLQNFTEQELQQQLQENPDLSAATKPKKT